MTAEPKVAIWEGVYDAFADIPDAGAVFDEEDWIARNIEAVTSMRTRMTDKTSGAQISISGEYHLPLVSSMVFSEKKSLSVLDFGGALGTGFLTVAYALPKAAELTYLIVETAPMCKAGSKLFEADDRIAFDTELPVAPAMFDIVHAGSSLQYVEDWRGWFEAIAALASKHLILADIPAGEIPTFATAQQYYGRKIAHWFWNIDEIIETAADCGFELIFKTKYQKAYLGENGPLPMENFPSSHRLDHCRELIFRCQPTV